MLRKLGNRIRFGVNHSYRTSAVLSLEKYSTLQRPWIPKPSVCACTMSKSFPKRWLSNNSHTNCPECERSILKCRSCGSLIPPKPETSYFDVMNQKLTYDVSESELKKIYRQLQSEFHPDKYSQSSEKERQISEEISSIINKAYFTLTNPYERGMYLLKLNDRPFNEGDIQLGNEFLAKIMEINEELEDITNAAELEKFEVTNEIEIQQLSEKVSSAFGTGDFDSAKSDLNKMKYFLSIKNRLRDMQRNM